MNFLIVMVSLRLNIYKGQEDDLAAENLAKFEDVILRLFQPYINQGYHLFMDNYYNSLSLPNQPLDRKTHVKATLGSKRKVNPVLVAKKNTKEGEKIFR